MSIYSEHFIQFDDPTLSPEAWRENMLAAIEAYNVNSGDNLDPQETLEEYIEWRATVWSDEANEKLWKKLVVKPLA